MPADDPTEPTLDPAELAALSSALDDLTRRVTTLADRFASAPREGPAATLYEVERQLGAAARRLRSLA